MINTESQFDFVIIGAGIIGMSIAHELICKDHNVKIAIIEKESDVAFHASGRNSGVLHAGFYYGEKSLKAKFCVEGNRLMKEFCKKHGLVVNENKKVIVAKNEKELKGLFDLYEKGKTNGVSLDLVDESDLKEINPGLNTHKKALLSPTTATIDPKNVCYKLKQVLESKGVVFYFNERFKAVHDNAVVTESKSRIGFGFLFNSAGTYALDIAHNMGLKTDYVTLPFKGAYLKGVGTDDLPNINVYPVPDPKYPFLGVHVTATVDGDIKLGPTAMPAFWYEQYRGLTGFKLREFCKIMYYFSKMILFNTAGTRLLAARELSSYRKSIMVKKSKKLLSSIDHTFVRCPAGIRAQLFDKKNKQWEMDFVVKKQGNVCHILNAVSPGFTCSFAFSKYLMESVVEF